MEACYIIVCLKDQFIFQVINVPAGKTPSAVLSFQTDIDLLIKQ